jgi:hypothetical protein
MHIVCSSFIDIIFVYYWEMWYWFLSLGLVSKWLHIIVHKSLDCKENSERKWWKNMSLKLFSAEKLMLHLLCPLEHEDFLHVVPQ